MANQFVQVAGDALKAVTTYASNFWQDLKDVKAANAAASTKTDKFFNFLNMPRRTGVPLLAAGAAATIGAVGVLASGFSSVAGGVASIGAGVAASPYTLPVIAGFGLVYGGARAVRAVRKVGIAKLLIAGAATLGFANIDKLQDQPAQEQLNTLKRDGITAAEVGKGFGDAYSDATGQKPTKENVHGNLKYFGALAYDAYSNTLKPLVDGFQAASRGEKVAAPKRDAAPASTAKGPEINDSGIRIIIPGELPKPEGLERFEKSQKAPVLGPTI